VGGAPLREERSVVEAATFAAQPRGLRCRLSAGNYGLRYGRLSGAQPSHRSDSHSPVLLDCVTIMSQFCASQSCNYSDRMYRPG
jgi:hypothetical protein